MVRDVKAMADKIATALGKSGDETSDVKKWVDFAAAEATSDAKKAMKVR